MKKIGFISLMSVLCLTGCWEGETNLSTEPEVIRNTVHTDTNWNDQESLVEWNQSSDTEENSFDHLEEFKKSDEVEKIEEEIPEEKILDEIFEDLEKLENEMNEEVLEENTEENPSWINENEESLIAWSEREKEEKSEEETIEEMNENEKRENEDWSWNRGDQKNLETQEHSAPNRVENEEKQNTSITEEPIDPTETIEQKIEREINELINEESEKSLMGYDLFYLFDNFSFSDEDKQDLISIVRGEITGQWNQKNPIEQFDCKMQYAKDLEKMKKQKISNLKKEYEKQQEQETEEEIKQLLQEELQVKISEIENSDTPCFDDLVFDQENEIFFYHHWYFQRDQENGTYTLFNEKNKILIKKGYFEEFLGSIQPSIIVWVINEKSIDIVGDSGQRFPREFYTLWTESYEAPSKITILWEKYKLVTNFATYNIINSSMKESLHTDLLFIPVNTFKSIEKSVNTFVKQNLFLTHSYVVKVKEYPNHFFVYESVENTWDAILYYSDKGIPIDAGNIMDLHTTNSLICRFWIRGTTENCGKQRQWVRDNYLFPYSKWNKEDHPEECELGKTLCKPQRKTILTGSLLPLFSAKKIENEHYYKIYINDKAFWQWMEMGD